MSASAQPIRPPGMTSHDYKLYTALWRKDPGFDTSRLFSPPQTCPGPDYDEATDCPASCKAKHYTTCGKRASRVKRSGRDGHFHYDRICGECRNAQTYHSRNARSLTQDRRAQLDANNLKARNRRAANAADPSNFYNMASRRRAPVASRNVPNLRKRMWRRAFGMRATARRDGKISNKDHPTELYFSVWLRVAIRGGEYGDQAFAEGVMTEEEQTATLLSLHQNGIFDSYDMRALHLKDNGDLIRASIERLHSHLGYDAKGQYLMVVSITANKLKSNSRAADFVGLVHALVEHADLELGLALATALVKNDHEAVDAAVSDFEVTTTDQQQAHWRQVSEHQTNSVRTRNERAKLRWQNAGGSENGPFLPPYEAPMRFKDLWRLVTATKGLDVVLGVHMSQSPFFLMSVDRKADDDQYAEGQVQLMLWQLNRAKVAYEATWTREALEVAANGDEVGLHVCKVFQKFFAVFLDDFTLPIELASKSPNDPLSFVFDEPHENEDDPDRSSLYDDESDEEFLVEDEERSRPVSRMILDDEDAPADEESDLTDLEDLSPRSSSAPSRRASSSGISEPSPQPFVQPSGTGGSARLARGGIRKREKRDDSDSGDGSADEDYQTPRKKRTIPNSVTSVIKRK